MGYITFSKGSVEDVDCLILKNGELQNLLDEPIDSVLGMNFLECNVFALDYQKKEMQLWTPDALTQQDIGNSDWAGSVAIPFSISKHYLFNIKAKINGKKEVSLVIDTGSSHTVLPANVGDALRLPYEVRRYGVVGGTISVHKIDIDTLSVGDLVWKSLDVHYPDPKTPDAFMAVLGARELSQYRILFDGIGKMAYFQRLPDKKETPAVSPN